MFDISKENSIMISTDYAVKALINRQKRLNQVKFYKDSLNNISCIFDSCIYFISQLQMNILTQYIIKIYQNMLKKLRK